MNIKRNISKLVSGLLCFSMIFSNVLPAYAADAVITENTLDGEDLSVNERNLEDITVTYKQASSFFVTIPKTIVLDGWKQSTYAVKVSGDIDAEQCVYVAPVDGIADTENIDFYMKDQASENAKDDVVANVTHNKFHWNSAEVTEGYKQDDNLVSAPDLTAGAWRGIFQMEIKLETHVTHKHNYVAVITKEPTCTETGEKTYTCTCGESYTEEIPAKGHHFENGECTDCGEKDSNHKHSYTETITKQPTCTEKGEKTFTCSCGDSYTEEIPATGHKDTDGDGICDECGENDPNHKHSYTEKIAKEPTCTEKGEKTFTCSCGDSYTEEIAAKGHSYVDGECEHCHEKDPDYHKHSYDEGVVTKEPTCTEVGEKTFTCSECGHTYTEEIPATGHNYENHICTNCGETDPSHVHNYEPYKLTVEPEMISSTLSGGSTSNVVAWKKTIVNDDYTQYYTNIIYPYRNLTSTIKFNIDMPEDYEGEFDYEYSYTCSPSSNSAKNKLSTEMKVNGERVYRNYQGSVSGTSGNILTVPLSAGKNTLTVQYIGGTTDPLGCTDTSTAILKVYKCVVYDGSEYHICNECGKKEAHVFGEPIIKYPTCLEAGEKRYTCSVCGGQRIEEIPAQGHHYVQGVCDVCGDLNTKLTTTTLFSVRSSNTAGTENGHGHLDRSSLAGTYSENIEITEDMVEGEYLSLDFCVRPPFLNLQGRWDLVEGLSGSTILQKYDEETDTWNTVYSYPISLSTIGSAMNSQEGGYNYAAYCGITKHFKLEKGTYRVYGAFSSSTMCSSTVAHNYCWYSITAELCQEVLDTQ